MQTTWKRIESWLAANAPKILNDLLPGATDEQFRSAEKLLGVEFPDDVKTSYNIHNGQQGLTAPLIGEWQLLSLKDIVSQWEIMKDLFDAGKFNNVTSTPIGPIKTDWWNVKWIPVAYNGAGDLYCLDLDPALGGDVGQIISFWHMEDRRERLAKNFQEWLQGFADDLEDGKYKLEKGRLVISKKKGRKKKV